MDCREHAVEAYDEAYQRRLPDKRDEILTDRAYTKHCNRDYIATIENFTDSTPAKVRQPCTPPNRGRR